MSAPGRHVVVFGGSDCEPGDGRWRTAEALGVELARAGLIVVSGGYGGAMEAVSRGASEAGGRAVGVLCEAWGSQGNPYLSNRIVTKDLNDRLHQLIELGDAYIALPGSTGTLVELAMAWELMNKRLLPLRPLMCLGSFWQPVVSLLGSDSTRDPRVPPAAMPDRKGDIVQMCESPEQVVRELQERWR